MTNLSLLDRGRATAGSMTSFAAALPQLLSRVIRRDERIPKASSVALNHTVDDVITRMTELSERFEREHGPGDGVLWFNKLYLAVTRGVKQAIGQAGFFQAPEALARLDVIFAQLYFEAVDAVDRGEQPATLAWQLLFENRARADVLPIQFAVAGMNAHINHDLPIALLEQWVIEGRHPSESDLAHVDFSAVNDILGREEVKLKPELEPGAVRPLDRGELSRLDNKLGLWVVERAREHAWRAAGVLWDVQHLPPVRTAWLLSTDGVVAALSELLLEPVLLEPV